jgi:hypothetical protein
MTAARHATGDAIRAFDDAATIQFRMPRSGPGSVIMPADLLEARALTGVDDEPRKAATLRGPVLVSWAAAGAALLVLAHFAALAVRGAADIPQVIRLGAGLSLWFSAALLLASAALVALLTATAPRKERSRWALLTLALVATSVVSVLPDRGAVLMPAVVVVAVLAVLCGRQVLRRAGGRLVALGALTYLVGAVAVGWWLGTPAGAGDTIQSAVSGVTVALELLGLTLALSGLLRMTRGTTLHL